MKAIALANFLQFANAAVKLTYVDRNDATLQVVLHSILDIAGQRSLFGSGCVDDYSDKELEGLRVGYYAMSGC